MENKWTVYRLKFINIAEKSKLAGYDYVPYYKTRIPKAPAFKRVQGYKVKEIVSRLSGERLIRPEYASNSTTQHILRRPESTNACNSNTPHLSRRPVSTIGYTSPIPERPKSTNNLNNLLTSKRLDSANGFNTPHGSSISYSTDEKLTKGRKRALSDTRIRPTSDARLQRASENRLRTASDTRLRTASDTSIRTASDTRLRTASDTSIRTASDTRLRILTLNQPTVSSYIRFRMSARKDKKMDFKDIKDACDRHQRHVSIPYLQAKYRNWLTVEGINL
ncbi:unnamed protein product [Mytilus coruscus]|uniref:Uncharacterized protein n=1 Tax=Mytilus coruscus TaxID=42192 RepID=A0A6J8D3P9_MYTCO|nr:unnamed protein product [Mytilus coruscus]